MKALSVAAIVISIASASMAVYSYNKIDEVSHQVSELLRGIGDNAYLTIDPRLDVVIEDMDVSFGSYSNKLSGKIKLKVTNDDFPLEKFQVSLKIVVKDSRGKIIIEDDLYHKIEGRSVVFEFKDEYLANGDRLRASEHYDFEVASYSWGAESKIFEVVRKQSS